MSVPHVMKMEKREAIKIVACGGCKGR